MVDPKTTPSEICRPSICASIRQNSLDLKVSQRYLPLYPTTSLDRVGDIGCANPCWQIKVGLAKSGIDLYWQKVKKPLHNLKRVCDSLFAWACDQVT
jgi:hypothetical protein